MILRALVIGLLITLVCCWPVLVALGVGVLVMAVTGK